MVTSSSQMPQSRAAATYKDLCYTSKVKLLDSFEGHPKPSQQEEDEMGSISDLAEGRDDEDNGREKTLVKKRKYQAMDESYRLNRTMRDKDFKLARSNFYSFKDTLGKSIIYLLVYVSLLLYLHNFFFYFLISES